MPCSFPAGDEMSLPYEWEKFKKTHLEEDTKQLRGKQIQEQYRHM